MTESSFIENELKKFNVTDAAIAELSEEYMPLVINGIDDKSGQKAVKEARLIIKRYRIDIDKRRKELNSDALEFQRRINGEAKRITALLEPIETHLAAEEKKVDDEWERIKREKELLAEKHYQSRCAELTELKFLFNGSKFYARYADVDLEIYILQIKQWSDDEFYAFLGKAKVYFDIHEKQLAEQKAKEEEERKALAAERARLDSIAKEQAERERALREETARLDYEKAKEAVMRPCPPECEAPIHYTFKQPEDQPAITLNINNHGTKRIGGVYTEKPLSVSIEDDKTDVMCWQSFDAAIEMVFNSLNKYDSAQLDKFTVCGFIDQFTDDLLEEVELYKKDS